MNKICTSLEQSKKLIELGIDIYTADMYWKNGVSDKYIQCFTPFVSSGTDIDYDYDIPAWSLAALLGIMPKEVKIKGQIYAPCLFPIIDGHWLYKLWYNSNEIIESPIAIWCDNPVDACYEMIIKLHELNLL